MTFLLSELGNLFHQKVGDEMKEYIGDWLNVLMTLLLSTLTSCHLIVSSCIMASGRRRYARQMEYGMVLYGPVCYWMVLGFQFFVVRVVWIVWVDYDCIDSEWHCFEQRDKKLVLLLWSRVMGHRNFKKSKQEFCLVEPAWLWYSQSKAYKSKWTESSLVLSLRYVY